MESRPTGPEEQDESTDKSSSKKKRGSGALSRYLSVLRSKEPAGIDTNLASDEKPRRIQRLLTRLFPGIVERPAHLSPEEPETSEHEFNRDTWFSWTRLAEHTDSPGTLDESRHIASPEGVLRPLPTSTEVPAPVEVPAIGRTEGHSEVPSVSGDELARPSRYDETSHTIDARPASTTPVERIEHETVVERTGNALPVVLVGAEYLARKRADKKLEARVDRKIEATRKEQKQQTQLQHELERVVSQNKQQVERLKQARAEMGKEVRQVQVPKEAIVTSPELHQSTESHPRADKVKAPSSETIVQPQKIAERVADAAEHDVPVERAFERSHEVKDDQPIVTGAASVGSVVSSHIAAASLRQADTNTTASSHSAGNLPVIAAETTPEMYKQAAATGFWSAVVIMVLGVIAYLVIK